MEVGRPSTFALNGVTPSPETPCNKNSQFWNLVESDRICKWYTVPFFQCGKMNESDRTWMWCTVPFFQCGEMNEWINFFLFCRRSLQIPALACSSLIKLLLNSTCVGRPPDHRCCSRSYSPLPSCTCVCICCMSEGRGLAQTWSTQTQGFAREAEDLCMEANCHTDSRCLIVGVTT